MTLISTRDLQINSR